MTKPLSKRAKAKLRAEHKRLQRQQAAERLARARAAAREAAAKLPPEWQGWGVTRTLAWDRYAQFVKQQAGLVSA